MDPELEQLYSALYQADDAGAEDEAQYIAGLIRERKARAPAQAQQPAQTRQPAQAAAPRQQPNLDMTPEKKPDDFFDNLGRGVDRLPNLVGLGNISTGFTKADLNPLDAAGRFATGAVRAPIAATVATGDAFALGLPTRLAGMLPGSSYEKALAAKKSIMEGQPLAEGLGTLTGYGLGGAGLAKIPGSVAGLTTKGMGVQGGLMAGGSALVQNPTDPLGAVAEGATGAAFGKALEGVGNVVIKPLAQKYLPKIERALTGKKGREAAGFDIPEELVQQIANRTRMPAAEITKNLKDFAAVHGPDSPRFLSLVNAETAGQFRALSKAKTEANVVFREGEEAAGLARPDVVGRAVERTGPVRGTAATLQKADEAGQAALSRKTQEAADEAARLTASTTARQRFTEDAAEAGTRRVQDTARAELQAADDAARAQQQDIVDAATAETQAIRAESTATRRMVRDETDALKKQQEAKVKASGTRLSTSLQQRAQGIKSDAEVLDDLATYTDDVMGKMRDTPIVLPRDVLPVNPKVASKALLSYAQGVTDKAEYAVIMEMVDALGKNEPFKTTIGKADLLRQVFGKAKTPTSENYPLRQAGNTLRDAIAKQHRPYKEDYLDVYADVNRALEARAIGSKVVGANSAEAVADVALMGANAERAATRLAIKQGAEDAALRTIAGTTKDGAQALAAAANIIRNADAIIKIAGREGEALVKTVRTTMDNVQRIQREIAQITEAARNTREGVADAAAANVRRVKREATGRKREVTARQDETKRVAAERQVSETRDLADRAADIKRRLTDVQKERMAKLERTAKAQLDVIKERMSKNTRAIQAASNLMKMTERELADATAGAGPQVTRVLGDVARGAIRGRAMQSPKDAIQLVENLATPSTGRKITQVAGARTGEALQKVGETQRREIANLSAVAARKADDQVVGEELSLAMEAGAALAGRAGPGYTTAILKRGANALGSLGISNKAAKAVAEAVVRNDKAYVEKLIKRLGKTELQRKRMATAIRAWVVSTSTDTVADVR
jgi:hypothetical protein